MPVKILIFFALNAFAFASFAEKDLCEHYLHFEKRTYTVWDVVTSRASVQIEKSLSKANSPRSLAGVKGMIPAFDLPAVQSGQKSILSLGEGESDFIYGILQNQKRLGLPLTAYAVDMIYRSTALFVDEGLADDEMISVYMSEFPENYHGSYFQNLNLRNQKSEPMLFDEVISSFSLSNLLQRRPNRLFKWTQSMEHDLQLLRKVMENLKKGGVLRIWPAPFVSRLPDVTEGSRYMRKLFDQLLSEGTISNHNFSQTDLEGPFGALLLQR